MIPPDPSRARGVEWRQSRNSAIRSIEEDDMVPFGSWLGPRGFPFVNMFYFRYFSNEP